MNWLRVTTPCLAAVLAIAALALSGPVRAAPPVEPATLPMPVQQVAEDTYLVQGLSAMGSAANQNFISNAAFVVTPEGVLVVEVAAGSVAEERGVLPGDVVLEINQRPVGSPEAFKKILDEDARKKGAALLLILRRGQNLFLTIPVDK